MAASKSQLAKQNFPDKVFILRIGVFYNRTQIDELVTQPGEFVEIGVDKSSSSNIILLEAENLPPELRQTFTLLDFDEGQPVLYFNENITGKLQGSKGKVNINRDMAGARKRGNNFVVPLTYDQIGQVNFGDYKVLFQFIESQIAVRDTSIILEKER